MKKIKIIFIFFLILAILLLILGRNQMHLIENAIIVTAKAVYSSVSISITLTDITAPTITVLSPKNETYNYLHPIYLNYTITEDSSSISQIFYSLNGAQNLTAINGSILPNILHGINTLIFYANNSAKLLANKTVVFNVNISASYDIYFPSNLLVTGPNSIDINLLNSTQQQNIENLTLYLPSYGKIVFKERINLTDDNKDFGGCSRKIINLTRYTNLSFNKFIIDSLNLPNLNRSATLFFYNLTFTNPRIMIDNETCPTTICTIISYSNGILEADVEHFTEYYAVEKTSSGTGSSALVSGHASAHPEEETPAIKPATEIKPAESKLYKEEPLPLFDVSVSLSKETINKGSRLVTLITLTNLGIPKEIDVTLNYVIKDTSNNDIYNETEVVKVETQKEFIKVVNTTSLKEGRYLFSVDLNYEGQKTPAKATTTFNIVKQPTLSNEKLYMMLFIILLTLIVIIIITRKQKHK